MLPDEVFTILSSIPEAEKFAKFWICKAKFLASKGTFDVVGLYEEAVRHGATVSVDGASWTPLCESQTLQHGGLWCNVHLTCRGADTARSGYSRVTFPVK